jgi:hypothetical protein
MFAHCLRTRLKRVLMARIPKGKNIAAYILEIGGVKYVGSTGNLTARLNHHQYQLSRGNHPNGLLQEAFNNSDKPVPLKVTPFLAETRDKAYLDEQLLLDASHGKDGYANIHHDARRGSPGIPRPIEAVEKTAAALKGRLFSPEHRENIRQAALEIAKDPEWRASCGRPGHPGHQHSEETRVKMSESAKNRSVISEETRAKLSTAHTGKIRSREAVAQGAAKIKRPVIVDGVGYAGLTEAAQAHNITPATAHNRINKSKLFDNWQYVDQEV